MAVSPGAKLGPYEIVSLVGAGGMGEVYRARDTRLGRDVAIKVLPAEFASDPERLRRFEQEARATSALNHTNILSIFDVGTHDGSPFIVEELLEGETLRASLDGGALPVRRAVELAVQVANGLAAAHGKGIVHRDLKPENVFVTGDGTVKILDFGLAKLVAPVSRDQLLAASTVTYATEAGVMLGTLSYMSPEQVRGQQVDGRSDIFSFGCVLYEMVSGQKPFRGPTATDVMAAIVRDEPPPLPEPVPQALQRIVWQCLEKRAEGRFSSAHDLALALQASASDVVVLPGRVSVSPLRRPRWPALAGLGLVSVVTAMVAVMWLRTSHRDRTVGVLDPKKILVSEFEDMTGDPSLDPIGSMVAQAVSQGLVELGDVEVVSAPPLAGGGAKHKDDIALRTAARVAGAGTLVSGSYYLSGGDLELRGRVTDVASGKLVYALKPETGPRGAPTEAVDRVRQRVMGATILRLGDAPALGGVKTPPLYSAYQEYVAGARSMGVDPKAVVAHFERAAAIDPEFWHPQLRLMAFYSAVGDTARHEALKKHLQDSQDKFGPADLILFQYYEASLAGRTLEAYRKARELLALAPRDWTYMYGAANLAVSLNRPREALESIGDIEKIDWKTFGHWMQGTWLLGVATLAHHLVGEYESELAVAELGVRHYPDMLNVRQDQVRALAALGRIAEVDGVVTASLAIRARSDTPGGVMLTAAQELRTHGHADASRRVAAQGAAWYAGLTGEDARPVRVPLSRIECLWLAGRWDEARTVADQVTKASPQDLWVVGYRGILAARAGDRPAADAMERQLAGFDAKRARGAPTYLRACIAAQRGERDRAVELLREALAHGLQTRGSMHVYMFLEPLHGYRPFEELIKPQG